MRPLDRSSSHDQINTANSKVTKAERTFSTCAKISMTAIVQIFIRRNYPLERTSLTQSSTNIVDAQTPTGNVQR